MTMATSRAVSSSLTLLALITYLWASPVIIILVLWIRDLLPFGPSLMFLCNYTSLILEKILWLTPLLMLLLGHPNPGELTLRMYSSFYLLLLGESVVWSLLDLQVCFSILKSIFCRCTWSFWILTGFTLMCKKLLFHEFINKTISWVYSLYKLFWVSVSTFFKWKLVSAQVVYRHLNLFWLKLSLESFYFFLQIRYLIVYASMLCMKPHGSCDYSYVLACIICMFNVSFVGDFMMI